MTAKRKSYPTYKSTNIEWLGEVPAHWQADRLKWSVTMCRNGIWGDEPDGVNDVVCVRVADFDRTGFVVHLENPTLRAVSECQRNGRVLGKGDLLLEKSGGGELQPVGAVMLFDQDLEAVCSNFVARMPVATGFDGRYLTYFHAHLYSGRVNTRSIKQTTGIQNLDSDSYLNENVPYIPLDEQRQIAAFLDRETARIDELVAKKRRLIELLKEKRTALISHAVTKLKGPEFQLKFSIQLTPGYAFKSVGFSQDEADIRLLRGANIAPERVVWDDTVRWPKQEYENFEEYHLKAGDIVFGMDRPWVSNGMRVAYVSSDDVPALLLQRVARIRPRAGVSSDFLMLLFLSKQFLAYFEPILTGVSVPHISPEQIGAFRMFLPEIDSQKDIATQTIAEIRSLDALELRILDGMSQLHEYRSALISAAVTGKIDVRREA